jgi:hypothetical protein
MSGPTRVLAEFAAALSHDDLPPEVARRAKLLIFDTIGIALRARYDAESTQSLINAVDRLGMTGDSASVIGDTVHLPTRSISTTPMRAVPCTAARRSYRRRWPPLKRRTRRVRGRLPPSSPVTRSRSG